MVTFAGALTITLYLITDIEYPRLGLITIESFDHSCPMFAIKWTDSWYN